MNQRDTKASKRNPERPPAFRIVLRRYDRAEVDKYLPQLTACLSEGVDRYAHPEQARAELEQELQRLRQGSLLICGGVPGQSGMCLLELLLR